MHSGHDIRDASGSMVAIVHSPAADHAQGAKIAALMAAAPDLLDTLERFVTACHAYLPETTDQAFCGLYASARAAIARATGAAQ
jgi:hypothetical protein